MATTNKERVGRTLDLLGEGLRPFVDRHMGPAAGPGKDWVALLAAREAARHGRARELSGDDPRLLLKVLTEEWRVFGDSLSRVEQSYASELRQVGNDWAHKPSIGSNDTARALDTAERLLTAVGAPTQAAQVGRMRAELQRQVYEEQTRQAVRVASGNISTPGTGLKAWREVVTPHEDVRTGRFNAAEFAADLHQVATGQALQPEYADPVEFFARTYLTTGLRDLLDRAARRLSKDDNASPVVNLQTNFGGGKTHSMLALFHLFGGVARSALPDGVQQLLDDADPATMRVNRVALVGTHLGPDEPLTKPDGTQVRTLWGELAWQLGGRAAYNMVARADASGTAPGQALTDVIRAHSPALILIDEWVAYARGLYGVDGLAGGSFETQFTFAQHLTDAVRAVPGAMLVVSIPASDSPGQEGAGSALEIGGANGQAALEKLQHVVGRTADHWRPATAVESFEIVRRRLFEEPDAAARADIAAVARQFVGFYREHHGQFPRDVESTEYEDRLKAAYPVHPEMFDRLYNDWSTLEKFQRTRGVLRLMSKVIHALWAAGDASPLILPGTVPLHTPEVFGELTNYLSDNWKPIVDADIDGEGSTPVSIDNARKVFGARSLTRRIARTVFLGSAATLGASHKGVERPRLWLGVAIPGDTLGNFGSSLEVLGQEATFLYADSGRYWFDTQASVARTAKDIADRLADEPERVWHEVIRRLSEERSRRGDFASVHVAPDDSGDIPDTDEARLVVLHPRHTHGRNDATSAASRFVEKAVRTVGSGQRVRQNMIVFAAADRQRYEELEPAVREFLAWDEIRGRVGELNLTEQQRTQAATRRTQADETVRQRIGGAWTWLLYPEQSPGVPFTVEAERIPEGQGALAERVSTKLARSGHLATRYGAASIRLALNAELRTVWLDPNGEPRHVSVDQLWDLFTRYPYLDRVRDRRVFDEAVLSTFDNPVMWQGEGFALAQGYDETDGRYVGLVQPSASSHFGQVTDTTLVVHPAVASKQIDSPSTADTSGPGARAREADATTGAPMTPVPGAPTDAASPLPPRTVAYRGLYSVSADRYGRDLSKLAQEVLPHLAAAAGGRLEIHVEIKAEAPDGFSPETIRAVSENAATLRFTDSGFLQE